MLTLGKKTEAASYLCRIEEIDFAKKTVLVHCSGIKTPVKLKFNEIMSDFAILSRLSPQHASWVGYYYGHYYTELLQQEITLPNFAFELGESKKRYTILLQNRQGSISYLDNLTNTLCTKRVTDILTTKELIMDFGSLEACYLGFLAGIAASKNKHRRIAI